MNPKVSALFFVLVLALSALPGSAQELGTENEPSESSAGILSTGELSESPRPRLQAIMDALSVIDLDLGPEPAASPFEPPGRPSDRPPGSPPGQGDPPNPPGRPSDRPSGELPPGQTR